MAVTALSVAVVLLIAAVVDLWRRLSAATARIAALEDFQRVMSKSTAGLSALRQEALAAEAAERQRLASKAS